MQNFGIFIAVSLSCWTNSHCASDLRCHDTNSTSLWFKSLEIITKKTLKWKCPTFRVRNVEREGGWEGGREGVGAHLWWHGIPGWWLQSQFPLFWCFPSFFFFRTIKKLATYWMLHSYLTGVKYVKYECDIKKLRTTFATSKISLMEKITNGALVAPIPGQCLTFCTWHF